MLGRKKQKTQGPTRASKDLATTLPQSIPNPWAYGTIAQGPTMSQSSTGTKSLCYNSLYLLVTLL